MHNFDCKAIGIDMDLGAVQQKEGAFHIPCFSCDLLVSRFPFGLAGFF